MKNSKLIVMLFGFIVVSYSVSACSDLGFKVSEDQVYTLYRNSITDPGYRIHVATFDADEPDTYNQENCEIARELFRRQSGVKVRYWCEKGYFKD